MDELVRASPEEHMSVLRLSVVHGTLDRGEPTSWSVVIPYFADLLETDAGAVSLVAHSGVVLLPFRTVPTEKVTETFSEIHVRISDLIPVTRGAVIRVQVLLRLCCWSLSAG